MNKKFTKKFMQENCGCYSEEQLLNCSFMKNETISIESILNSEIKLKDKYWFVCKKLLTKEQNKQVAVAVAEIVLPIYEKRYPENKAPREAIESAKKYIAGHISLEQLKEKRSNTYTAAAYAAYDATAAAYDAAYAAYDATAAAYDADDAAYAAADDAAAAAAADAAYTEFSNKLLSYLKEFCNQS